MPKRRGRPPDVPGKLMAHYMLHPYCTHSTFDTALEVGVAQSRIAPARRALEAAGMISILRLPSEKDAGGFDRVYVSLNRNLRPVLYLSNDDVDSSRNENGTNEKHGTLIPEGDVQMPSFTFDASEPRPSLAKRRVVLAPVTEFLHEFDAQHARVYGGHYQSSKAERNLALKMSREFELDILKLMVKHFFMARGYGAPTLTSFWLKRGELREDAREEQLQRETDNKLTPEERAADRAAIEANRRLMDA